MSPSTGDVPVLIAAGGEEWESAAVGLLNSRGSGVAVHKRCVDLSDLVASASTGLARAALVGAGLAGLDGDAVAALARSGVGTVVVLGRRADEHTRQRLGRLGVRALVEADLTGLHEALRAAAALAVSLDERGEPPPDEPVDWSTPPPGLGRTVVVWGPAGAPGRTTVATGLAAEIAHRGRTVLLLDADPYGGAVAQHLGVLDGASGLLAAVRAANAGELDAIRLAGLARSIGSAGSSFRMLTGLPRPDRWQEVRAPAFGRVLDAARGLADWLVVDVGFSLEGEVADPFAAGPQRNLMTTAALERADEVVVVGAADPVALARLARGLVDLHDLVPEADVRVVVNRARPSLGWSEQEITGMVEGFVRARSVHFLPDDRPGADRALMGGRSLVESGDCALRRGVAGVAEAVAGDRPAPSRRRLFRRPRLRS